MSLENDLVCLPAPGRLLPFCHKDKQDQPVFDAVIPVMGAKFPAYLYLHPSFAFCYVHQAPGDQERNPVQLATQTLHGQRYQIEALSQDLVAKRKIGKQNSFQDYVIVFHCDVPFYSYDFYDTEA